MRYVSVNEGFVDTLMFKDSWSIKCSSEVVI